MGATVRRRDQKAAEDKLRKLQELRRKGQKIKKAEHTKGKTVRTGGRLKIQKKKKPKPKNVALTSRRRIKKITKWPASPDNFYHILIVNGKAGGADDFPWIDHCLDRIHRLTTSPHKIYIFEYTAKKYDEEIEVVRPNKHFEDYVNWRYPKTKGGRKYIAYQHQAGLSYLAYLRTSGWIITLDSDSLPLVGGWEKKLSDMCGPKGIVGAQRRLGGKFGKIAHPACFCMSAPLYQAMDTDFFRQGRTGDTAVKLTETAKWNKVKVKLLPRSNDFPKLKSQRGSVPASFSVHEDIVYHHGCGSRMKDMSILGSKGRRSVPAWVYDLSEHIKKLIAADFNEFVKFVREGKWPI